MRILVRDVFSQEGGSRQYYLPGFVRRIDCLIDYGPFFKSLRLGNERFSFTYLIQRYL